jgi:hypothetical protein
MNRDEVVLLVSRALACIQAITAILDASYMPERFMSLHHYVQEAQLAASVRNSSTFELTAYYVSLDRTEIAFFFGRIAFLLLMALLFWNCGPRIARFLLLERKTSPAA